jgi:hypothetical protein
MSIAENIEKFRQELPEGVELCAISKVKPKEDILEAYETGQRVFGENKIQEMTDKQADLPEDIQWQMVGHVQTNKVKDMAPYVSLIHAVHKMKLLKEINKRAKQNERIIDCLIQVKIADEDSKFGMDADNLDGFFDQVDEKEFKNVRIIGLMGMATLTEDESQIEKEFKSLKEIYDNYSERYSQFSQLSMGMSGDYKIAVNCGSTMVRIGSSIFGPRNYDK